MKKKIAIVHASMVLGGVEKALINLLQHIDYSKYDVTLWLLDNSGPLITQVDPHVEIRLIGNPYGQYRFFINDLIRCKKYAMLPSSMFYYFLFKFSEHIFDRAFFFKLKSQLLESDLFSAETYDVAICYQSLSDACLRAALCFIAPVRLAWLHGDYIDSPDQKRLRLTKMMYRRYDRIVCVSEGVRKIQESYFPTLREKFCVIYNLQDIQAIRELAKETPDDPFDGVTLLTVGRLSSEKGQDMIPEIARNLLNKGFQFVWYVVGDGPIRGLVEDSIREYHVEDTVILTGKKDNPYPYIKNCSLYVQPSYQEGFCVASFEAKILQTPVVVTEVPGMREQFTDKTAFFAHPTVDSLTETISKALTTPLDRAALEPVTEEFNNRELKKFYQLLEG